MLMCIYIYEYVRVQFGTFICMLKIDNIKYIFKYVYINILNT